MLADVNVLVAAYRVDHSHHLQARKWLDEALSSDKPRQLHLTIGLISSCLRILTNPRAFPAGASSSADAIAYMDWLVAHPRVSMLKSGEEWPTFRRLVADKSLQGNLVPDAHLAAVAAHHRLKFATFDKGFKKLLPASLLEIIPSSTAS